MVAMPIWRIEVDDRDAFLFALLGDTAWHLDAACREHDDPDVWFPGQGESSAEAKSVCNRCLVQRECLDYALDVGPWLHGIWGGAGRMERAKLLKAGVTGDLVRRYGVNALEGRKRALDFATFDFDDE